MTKVRLAGPTNLKVTWQQAGVWAHITNNWQTVSEIHAFMQTGPNPAPTVALNTVKNSIKWLLSMGVIIQASHVSPARFKVNEECDEVTFFALNDAAELYAGLDE
jgi:hypothetical protein